MKGRSLFMILIITSLTISLLIGTVSAANEVDVNSPASETARKILNENASSSSSPYNDKPTGRVEEIVIEDMFREDNPGLAGYTGFGYMGTLFAENKTYIIKLYQSDWNTIMSITHGNPKGKKLYVIIEHDDFEEKWDGDNFYFIDSYYDSNGNFISS